MSHPFNYGDVVQFTTDPKVNAPGLNGKLGRVAAIWSWSNNVLVAFTDSNNRVYSQMEVPASYLELVAKYRPMRIKEYGLCQRAKSG